MANDTSKHSNGKKGLRIVRKRPSRKSKVRITIEILGDTLLLERQLNKMDIESVKQDVISELREIGDLEICRFEVELD